MRIIVLPKSQAEAFRSDKPWAAISITNSHLTHPLVHAKLSPDNRVGLLQLDFDDVNHVAEGAFAAEHADKIIDFVRDVFGRIDALVVHCHMGMSRSPGVAAAVYKLLTDGDDSYYFKAYTPNTRVYNGILQVARHRGIKPGELAKD